MSDWRQADASLAATTSRPSATVDSAAVERLARHLVESDDACGPAYDWSEPGFWIPDASPAERSQYFTVGNAINFRFWMLEEQDLIPSTGLVDGQHLIGSSYMWRCLRRAYDAGVPILDADYLAGFDDRRFDEVFRDDNGHDPLRPARQDRIKNLRNLGSLLLASWEGQFFGVVRASGGMLDRFASLSSVFRAFDDPVMKLTMVNAIQHVGAGLATFDRPPHAAVDYHLLKQLLRQGVVVPDSALRDKLIRGDILTTADDLSLRSAAFEAFERLSDLSGVPTDVLDNLWWFNGRRCSQRDPVCTDESKQRLCPFLEVCARRIEIGQPLAVTRYY